MSRYFRVEPGGALNGALRVPGDKSVSHRSLMLGAIADGRTEIEGFLAGADCLATLSALRAMGVEIDRPSPTAVRVAGVGLHGLRAPEGDLDMGNSGTAMRLFAGLLSAQSFDTVLTGDESLSERPMERVAAPLREMGASIESRDGRPPLRIRGGQELAGIDYRMPVASAQVKSALLLAGLYANRATRVTEPATTRDHSERMLRQFGADVVSDGATVTLQPGRLTSSRVTVPGDLSSAAFLLLGGCAGPGSELQIDGVGLNPTRTGILRILELMGADLTIEEWPATAGGEPMGRVTVRHARLHGTEIPPELVPLAIDEFPVVFVAAALAEGETLVTGAEELRHKESDRIAAMAAGLRELGVSVEEFPDGARILGGRIGGGHIDSRGDHRIAMAFAMAGLAADRVIEIANTDNVATSFPGFVALARQAGLSLEELGGDRA